MASEIQTLPDDVVDLIAAGETIDSLAAVIRELAENALDAGASRITIALWPELWKTQVIDNGRGMLPQDLQVCTQPHSTSKIKTHQDLWKITSLGFRGEALHSIAQVADLAICSRSSQADTGLQVIYRQAIPERESIMAIAVGTIVTVSNLFAKIPVRRRALPPWTQQLKSIQKLIQQLALCHPHVTWQIKQEQNLWFKISPGRTARDILPQFLRRVGYSDLYYQQLEVKTPILTPQADRQLVAVNTSKDNSSDRSFDLSASHKSQVELVIGLPDRCHRHRADWVKVSVNHRFVRSPELEQTILNSMAKILPRDRFPVCLLQIQTCPSQIDWNRHPAKTEIYLHSLGYWQERVNEAIAQALKFNSENITTGAADRRIGKMLKVAEASAKKYHLDRELAKIENTTPTAKINALKLTAIAQASKTYIVAEHAAGIWLVEQHIAHERVLYEQLQDCWELVPLKSPMILEYLKPQQLEQLIKLNLEIELFGENLWAVRNAPKILAEREDCSEAILELSWGGDLRAAQVATACRSAIRNGTTLDLAEMQNLLDLWQATRNPRTCPHGRPIYLSLEESSLSRFFRRHWMIGKSHGI